MGTSTLRGKQGAPDFGSTASSEIVEEGVRYKVLTVEQAQALWDAGCKESLLRTFSGAPYQWRDYPDTNNSPEFLKDRFGTFKWRIPIE